MDLAGGVAAAAVAEHEQTSGGVERELDGTPDIADHELGGHSDGGDDARHGFGARTARRRQRDQRGA